MTSVECDQCGAANSTRARFCMACGAALSRGCPACGASAQAAARFCIECGAALDAPTGADPAQSAAEERRTVTILFADIVGYTTVAERLDHESVKALTERYLTRLAREVERYGGYVDQYIGDNVMAVFGAPTAHEDDPGRAVRAAHGMHAAMAELNRTVATDFGLELALRVGVNTGEVLAGRIGTEYTVVGDAVNVAARLQTAAAVGRILVGDRTRRATAASVDYRQIGPLILKGKTDPVNAWEVLSIDDPQLPPQPRVARVPLVGREAEMALLIGLSERTHQERLPQLAVVLGEAGVGKTRLISELEQRLKRHVPRMYFMRGHATGFGTGSAFEPLAEMLRTELAILREDSESEVRAKLAGRLAPVLGGEPREKQLEGRLAPFVRLVAGGAGEPEGAVAEGDQEEARDSFFAAVRALIEQLATDQVPVLVWDDAQWADEGTLELIAYLDEWVSSPLVQICIGREGPLDRAAWRATLQRPVTRIALTPLTAEHAVELVHLLLEEALVEEGAEPLRQITARCGGNPLFAEALVDRLVESDDGQTGPLPDTVQSLLAVRLDALAPFERRLLGHASVVGPTFTRASLEHLDGPEGAELDRGLMRLCERNLIAPVGPEEAEEGSYSFRHVLIREAAYEMLPMAVRARKHTEVGELLETRQDSGGAAHQGALAEHFTRAASLAAEVHLPPAELERMRDRALRHGIAAGDTAAALFSNREALTRYRTATGFAEDGATVLIEIAEKLGEVESRLGHLDAAIAAWESCIEAHDAGGRVERSAEIHRKIAAALVHRGERDAAIKQLQSGINLVKDRPPSLAGARLFGEAATLYAQVGANMLAAYAAERALSYANQLGERGAASRAYAIQGGVFGRMGDIAKARESLDRAVAVVRDSDPQEAAIALFAAGRNLESSEGDYAAARDRYEEALATAERVGGIPMQVELNAALAHLALLGCDWDAAARGAELTATLAEQGGLVSMLCLADVLRGRLCWRARDWPGSEELLRRAHQAAVHNAWSEVAAQALLWLAATIADGGELQDAEPVLRDALALSERMALTPLAVEACAALALLDVRSGRSESAVGHARHALRLSEQGGDPVSCAAAQEARGSAAGSAQGVELLEGAQAGWESIGRPLESARCVAVRAERLRERGDRSARVLSAIAAERFEALGLAHLAERTRVLGAG